MPGLTIEKAPQTGLVWWIPLVVCLVGLAAAVGSLLASAPRAGRPLDRLAASLRRVTRLPAWSAAAVGLSLWSLTVALIGFAWDVAWHADLGRDKALFTPPHVMILVGLGGIGLSALAAVALATLERARVGLRLGPLHVPWSSIPMGFMGLGAVIGFPLDSWWHSVYGIDVTMWSPTHLLMIGGASLTPIAAWLVLAEAGVPPARGRVVRLLSEGLAAATLVGLSTFQLEFDMGIPQWQALYQPCLQALAMGIGLLAAREALGAGGALRATFGFLVLRGLVALLVGPAFGLTVERFPLYLGGALVVEGMYLLRARLTPLARVLLTGALVGTVGMAAEWGWTHAWGLQPWQPRLLPWWWAVLGFALVGSVLGAALGRAVAHAPRLVTFPAVALAFAGLVVLLAVPYPRHGADVTATVTAQPVGAAVPAVTRDGVATLERDLTATVTVSPADGVDGADAFRVVVWQGGDVVLRPLREVAPGRYAVDAPFPAGGDWKSLVLLLDGPAVAAVPIDFPADPQYNLSPIPAPMQPRTSGFEPASRYLMRESHGGGPLPAALAYAAFGVIGVGWVLGLIGVGTAMSRRLRATVPLGARPAGA